MSGRLAGRKILVTGASRGIGYAIAESFAAQGADLVISATSESSLESINEALSAYQVEVRSMTADISQADDVDSLFAKSVEFFPDLDGVVNNAGIHIGKPFTDYDMDEFDRIMKVNVYSVFQLMQLATRHMQSLGRGKVINIASTAGKWESMNQAAYNTTKHAVVGLTRCVALENAKNNINVNAICPGIVETDLVYNAATLMEDAGLTNDEVRQMIESRIPMGRMLQPQEVADIAVYLASSESDGMTGQTITISGGMRMG
ncbi:glucose 1-dehydrogenase [Gammaproteobacteria bacterium]|nr:glucose 1-dehydrogenase [Gammaproteobacteria bacterium]